jgi:ribonuclease Z
MSISRALAAAVICSALIISNAVGQESPIAGTAAKQIRVVLLGTAGGPPVRVDKAGISTLVEAGGERFLFDAGRGVMQRLAQAGVPMDGVTKLFLTHLHSDHIVDVPDLYLTPWSAPSERKVPLEVWGPDGTREMMQNLEKAFVFDIHVRRDLDEKISPEGIKSKTTEVREGTVYEQHGVKITAFLVDHGPVKPSFGYRLDCGGRSIVLSGDTRPSENLIKFSKGVDLLIHEAIDTDALRRLAPSEQLFKTIVEHHTTPEQAAEVFSRTKPRLAVFSHSPGTQSILDKARAGYSGRVEMGEDLMSIDIGDDIRITRLPRTNR